jgi:uncharacterized damage-inducible protein DinB
MAVPPDQLDYRPHERSTSAGDLAFQLAQEQADIIDLLDKQEATYDPAKKRPATHEEIIALWDQATTTLRERLQSLDEAKLAGKANFKVGEHVAWSDSLQNLLWGFLFDMVHHRGQMSTYLRPMGAKVPSIYGPSADDRG